MAGGAPGGLSKVAALLAASAGAAAQPVLQPSATPAKNGRRFLLWNLTGMVLSRDENTYAAIEVTASPFVHTCLTNVMRLADQ
jgi:hypothetical protein